MSETSNSNGLFVRGIFWNGLQLVINTVVSFGVKLILAKLILPEQFGVVGMATIVTGFVQIINELGIGASLVQRSEDKLKPVHYFTSFWTGVVWSVFLFLIMSFIAAPLAAKFYDQPILNKLIPVISVGILLSPLNLVNKSQLIKKMAFKKIAWIDNLANILGGMIAIGLAYMGMGVWSLAANSILVVLIAVPFYFKATNWYPEFIWDRTAFDDIFKFGVFTTLTNIVNYITNNVDYLLVGKLISAEALGAYTLAFFLTDTFKSRLVSVINNVTFPMYSKHQGDVEYAKRIYLKVIEYNCFLVFPVMLTLLFFGDTIILSIFGSRWEQTIIPLQILSGSVMIQMLVNSNTSLMRGLGKADFELKLQVFKTCLYIPSIVVGVYLNGIQGAAWGIFVNRIIAVFLTHYVFDKLFSIRITVKDFFKVLKGPFLASVAGIGVILLLNPFFNYVVSIIGFLVFFGLSTFLLKKGELNQILLKRILKKG